MKAATDISRELEVNPAQGSRDSWATEEVLNQTEGLIALNPLLLMHDDRLRMWWARCQWRLVRNRKRLLWSWVVNGTLALKRMFDVVGSLALLICLSPVLLLIALLVKLEDGGPILFRQTRVGRFGREFQFLSFARCV